MIKLLCGYNYEDKFPALYGVMPYRYNAYHDLVFVNLEKFLIKDRTWTLCLEISLYGNNHWSSRRLSMPFSMTHLTPEDYRAYDDERRVIMQEIQADFVEYYKTNKTIFIKCQIEFLNIQATEAKDKVDRAKIELNEIVWKRNNLTKELKVT